MTQDISIEEKKALFHEIQQHLLTDAVPSDYLKGLLQQPIFHSQPFSLLALQEKTEQSPIHHPEGNVWNHMLLVVDEAAKRREEQKDPAAFMWAALLHDIGKPPTTKVRKGKITSYNHEKVGAELAREFLQMFTSNTEFIDHISSLVRYHMQMLFVLKDLSFADVEEMKKHTDVSELGTLCLCDRLGRTDSDLSSEQENLRLFLEKVTRK